MDRIKETEQEDIRNTQERYQGEYFSILGDSISTLEGYSQPKYAAFYDLSHKISSGVLTLSDTWWGSVIEHLQGRVLVNHSISGSMVCKRPQCEIPSYGCSDERTAALSCDGLSPDVIMVFMGLNDWGRGASPIPSDEAEKDDPAIFSVAYRMMLEKLKRNYPASEIWCFTLPRSMCKRSESFVFPYRYAGWHIEEFCEVIRRCAEEFSCRLIDLYRYAEPYDTIDGFHPNADGMKTLADAVLARL